MKKERTIIKNNNGFTLVELIVVLVILAILAAILVPALLGYIDEAKRKQDVLDAKNLMTATQSQLTKLYAKNDFSNTKQYSIFPIKSATDTSLVDNKITAETSGQYNIFCSNSDFATSVKNTADLHPALFVVGLGQYNVYADGEKSGVAKDKHKAYTVMFAIYMKEKNSKPLFYDGKNWTDELPAFASTSGSNYDKNKVKIDGVDFYFQWYEICRDSSFDSGKKFWELYKEAYNNNK